MPASTMAVCSGPVPMNTIRARRSCMSKRSAKSERATLQNIDYGPSPERLSREFPYTLTTGRSLYQFNVGSMSMRTPNKLLRPTDTLDISPHDARALDIASGDAVRVRAAMARSRSWRA